MSSNLQQGGALLAWSRGSILARRSGYHLIAGYLNGSEQVVTQRGDPSHPVKRLGIRLLRRFSFTRWYTGGSFTMERQIRQHLGSGVPRPVHLLWCDHDMGFIDLGLDLGRHPLVGTFHQCADELPAIIQRPAALKKFAAIIVMSDTQRVYFEDQGVPRDRIHRILHGVDTDYFSPLEQSGRDKFVVLSVGGTRRDFPLMRAVAESLRNEAGVRFEIVGPRDREPVFAGLGNVTYFCGISDEALLERYRRASCYLHLAEAATANNALLEGMSCGAPVITQNVGGVPEYVTSEHAMLCPPHDRESVAAAVRELAASPARLAAMRTAARAHALTLDWRHAAARTQQLYQSLN